MGSGPIELEGSHDYIVSIKVSLGYCFGYLFWHAVGPARTLKYHIAFQALHANINEVKVFQDIARICKVVILVVHHIAFHGLQPPSRQKSASHKDFLINPFAGFSPVITFSTARVAKAM